MNNKTLKKTVINTLIAVTTGIALSTQVIAATRTTSYTYYDTAPKQALLHTIDGPRTDVTDITTLDYDNYGNLTSVINALGHSSQIIAHDASGRPLELVSPNQLHTQFQYDVRGRLTQSSTFLAGDELNARLTRYTYTPAGDIENLSVPSGETLTYTYDDARRLIQVTDSQGDHIVYIPDAMGNILSETIHASDTSIIQQQSAVYNQLGQLFKTIGAENQTTEYTYDLNGNTQTQLDARLNPTTQAFDGLNRLKSVLDAKAGTTDYSYDNAGNLNAVTDPNGHTTTYTYDGLGNLTSLNSPDTGLTTYDNHDAAGNLLQETNANNIVIHYTYDALNRLTEIQYPDSSQDITYFYDGDNYTAQDQIPASHAPIGQRTGMSDSSGTMRWFYNTHGELIQSNRTVLNGGTFISQHHYQASTGLLETTFYPDGLTIDYQYDTQGRIAYIGTQKDGQAQSIISNVYYQPFGAATQYRYGNGLTLNRSFDLDGRLTTQSLIGNSTTLQDLSWTYNPLSSVQNLTDLLDATLSQNFDYDELDRLNLAQTDISAYGLLGFAYDANGNRTQYTDNSQITDYSIALTNNQTDSASGAQPQILQHDARGNISQHIKNGNTFVYHYNQQNRLSQIDKNGTLLATYQYNGMGQRTRKTLANGTATHYLYTADGQLMSEIDASNTLLRNYLYFDNQPLLLVQHTQPQQTDIYQLTGSDNATPPRALSVLASISTQTLTITLHTGQTLQVTLDNSQWQTSETATEYIHTLNYSDTTGLAISGTITTSLIDDQSHAELTIINPLNYQFTQDYQTSGLVTQLPGITTHHILIPFDGLVIVVPKPIQSTQLTVDISTEIVHVTYADGHTQAFQIAASDWLVSSEGQTTRYDFSYQQGDDVLSGYLLQGDNETKASIDVHAINTSTISYTLPEQPNGYVLDEEAFYYYHSNHLGTPQLLTDKDQNIVWQANYAPFGEASITTETITNNLRFPGQYYDAESGLHFNWHRYYDPSLGRYITSDPIGLSGGLNTYNYVYQNPLNWVDPSGLSAILEGGVIATGAGGYIFLTRCEINPNDPSCVAARDLAQRCANAISDTRDKISDAWDRMFNDSATLPTGKSDKHGDSGRSHDKTKGQLDDLRAQADKATGKEKKKIKAKIKNIIDTNNKKKKGTEHWN